jgi:hypothetical protein
VTDAWEAGFVPEPQEPHRPQAATTATTAERYLIFANRVAKRILMIWYS